MNIRLLFYSVFVTTRTLFPAEHWSEVFRYTHCPSKHSVSGSSVVLFRQRRRPPRVHNDHISASAVDLVDTEPEVVVAVLVRRERSGHGQLRRHILLHVPRGIAVVRQPRADRFGGNDTDVLRYRAVRDGSHRHGE